MGLFNKIKNVLFEEEEVEEEVTPETEVAPLPKENIFKSVEEDENDYRPLIKEKEEVKVKEPTFEKVEPDDISERDLFRSESTFKFPAFDEDEFNTSMPKLKVEEPVRERKSDYPRIEGYRSKEKEEVKDEKKKFKPSPVISPVYGILNKDYNAEDIEVAPKNNSTIISSKDLDVESVRAKAFGKLENNLEKSVRKSVIKEETYEIKKEEKVEAKKEAPKKVEKKEEVSEDTLVISDEPIFEDNHNLIEERAKTIDELLKDASDDVIDVDDIKTDDELTFDDEEINEVVAEEKPSKESLETDTLENDLYDLIDSMYDNTEEGE